MTKLLNLFRRPADVQPLIWWLRIGFLILYWVIWVGLRGVNVWIVILLYDQVMSGSRLSAAYWLIIGHLVYFLPIMLFTNILIMPFSRSYFHFAITHLVNNIIFLLLLAFITGPNPLLIPILYSLLFLFDVLILLFFLKSKRYGFFRDESLI